MSKSELINALRNQMMTHTSLRHTRKRSDSSSFEPTVDDVASDILSFVNEYESMQHEPELSQVLCFRRF